MTTCKNDRMLSLRDAIEHPDKTTCSGYSLIGETTPGRLRKTLTPSVLGSDFIHSFMMVECPGGRPPENVHREHLIPAFLHEHVVNLCQAAIGNRDCQRHTSVKIDGAASLLLNTFNSYCDSVINGSDDDGLRLVWDRAHEKALRVAALLAVADDCMLPIITLKHAEWAQDFVMHSIGVVSRHNGGPHKPNKKVL